MDVYRDSGLQKVTSSVPTRSLCLQGRCGPWKLKGRRANRCLRRKTEN